MIIKAIIEELPEPGDNHYMIRIPFMEDHTKNKSIFSALLSHTPGIYDSYKVGDVVFISFENEKLDVPIILGKLYTPNREFVGSANFQNINIEPKMSTNNRRLADTGVVPIDLQPANSSVITNNLSLGYIEIEEW